MIFTPALFSSVDNYAPNIRIIFQNLNFQNPPPSEQDLQDFEADMMAIHRDVMRKARKDPKKMDLIRAAHAQMMAEINTTKTNDLGEMFMNVGRRNLGNVFNTD